MAAHHRIRAAVSAPAKLRGRSRENVGWRSRIAARKRGVTRCKGRISAAPRRDRASCAWNSAAPGRGGRLVGIHERGGGSERGRACGRGAVARAADRFRRCALRQRQSGDAAGDRRARRLDTLPGTQDPRGRPARPPGPRSLALSTLGDRSARCPSRSTRRLARSKGRWRVAPTSRAAVVQSLSRSCTSALVRRGGRPKFPFGTTRRTRFASSGLRSCSGRPQSVHEALADEGAGKVHERLTQLVAVSAELLPQANA
jgi:hypothetical protein